MLNKEYIMLEKQTSKSQDSDDRENKGIDNSCNLESKHDVITGWRASDKKLFTRHQFRSPRVLYTPVTQRNKTLLRYKMNKSMKYHFMNGINEWDPILFEKSFYKDLEKMQPSNSCNLSELVSPNSPHFNSSKPLQALSRSAKIMRALGKSNISSDHMDKNIKKSLTFDSSPSPKKNDSSEGSVCVDSIVNTPLHTPDKSLRHRRNSLDTSTSSVPIESLESSDENQNRTPRQSRIIVRIPSDTSDTERSKNKSGSSGSTSVLRSNMKERIESIIRDKQIDFQCSKRGDRLRTPTYDVAASTPRNLSKEFNEDEEDSSHTPEHVMQFIPDSMSSIKKSHQKERSYCLRRKAEQVDGCVKNVYGLHAKRTMESLEADDTPTRSSSCMVAVKESPKKSRNVKKALVYNLDDKLPDNESIFDHTEKKVPPKNTDCEMRLSNCKMHEENVQDIDDTSTSTSNHDNKENDSCLQEASSSNVDLAEREKAISSEYNLAISKDFKQDIDSLTSDKFRDLVDLYTSPKHRRYSNNSDSCDRYNYRKRSVPIPREASIVPYARVQRSQKEKMLRYDEILYDDKVHSRSSERPITPENINSSRLLLLQFTSVKKSHKKDKRKNKSIFGNLKHDVEDIKYHKKNIFAKKRQIEKYRNMSVPIINSSSDESINKKSLSLYLQSDKQELPHLVESSESSGSENIDDEFKIYTPIRKRISSSVAFKNYIWKGETSLGEENRPVAPAEATTDDNGRLTPVNMSTAELLCNIDSIKKSHKKDKHDGSICKRRILRKKPSEYTEGTGNVNFADCMKTSADHSTSSSKLNPNDSSFCDETGVCSNIRNEDNNESNDEDVYNPGPSTSRGNIVTESKKNIKKLKPLSTTPPNSANTLKFMKLLHTTSIKKSHKKERHLKKESKYILMSKEYDLSDDGSIFDEEDRLTNVESFSLCQDNKN